MAGDFIQNIFELGDQIGFGDEEFASNVCTSGKTA